MSTTEVAQRTPEQALVARVRSDVFREQVAMALPPTVTLDRFVRVASTAIMTSPDIAKLDHTSVLVAMVKIASLGLMPDGHQAAITPRKGKAVPVVMIQGYRDIAAEHGWTLRTAVVYGNDDFEHAVIDGEESIIHRPVRPGAERGELIASYAIAKHRDGRKLMTVLHPDDIAHRRRSSAYDAVWNEHPAAMWEKSAGRDLFGQLGLAENDIAQRALRVDIDADDATEALYGSAVRDNSNTLATSPPALPATDSSRQQADDPASPVQTPAGSSAPGEPEPSLDDEPAAFQIPADAQNDVHVALAMEAAQYVVPNGQNRDKTLGEIHASGDKGEKWIRWALRSITDPPAYRDAVWNFAKVFAPDDFTKIAAEKELQQ